MIIYGSQQIIIQDDYVTKIDSNEKISVEDL
jgi:hypothetical protein